MKDSRNVVRLDSRTLMHGEVKQSGGDPSTLFEILEGIVARKDWEILVDDSGLPVGSFRRFLEAPLPVGCGVKADKILALLQVEHRYEQDQDYAARMAKLRDDVQRLLALESPPLNDNGVNQYSGSDTSDPESRESPISKKGGTSRVYIIARLKRDAPDIAELVINKEISAAEGKRRLDARLKKPQPKTINLNIDDEGELVEILLENLDRKALQNLIKQLSDKL